MRCIISFFSFFSFFSLFLFSFFGAALAGSPVQFPGTNWSFIPPPGFVLKDSKTSGFKFKHANGAVIIMLQTARQSGDKADLGAINSVSHVGTPNEVRLERAENVTAGGRPAVLSTFRYTQSPVRSFNIIIEGEGSTALIYFAVPDSAQGIEPATIDAALLSATEDQRSMEQRLEDLPYLINETAGMRVVNIINNRIVYLTDGLGDQMDEHVEQPFVVVSVSPVGPGETFEPERDLTKVGTQIRAQYANTTIVSEQVEMTPMGPVAAVNYSRAPDDKTTSVAGTAWLWADDGNYMFVIAQHPVDKPAMLDRMVKIRDGISKR